MSATNHSAVSSGTQSEPGSLRGRSLSRRWFFTVTLGEFLGFSVPAVIGTVTAGASVVLAVAAVVVAGVAEGAMLGWAQASVLRRALPGLRVGHWIAATAGGAAFAYAIGMSPSTLAEIGVDLPSALLIVLAPMLGIALLLSIGTAQWLVLRKRMPRSAAWIAITAGAWTCGLVLFLAFAMPLWHPGQAKTTIAAIGLIGGLLMAATTSAITGAGMRRLLARTQRGELAPQREFGESSSGCAAAAPVD